jgi:hypothetical protein
MARDHRKYLLGLDKESGYVQGLDMDGRLSGVKPLHSREIKVFLENNPDSGLLVWEIGKTDLKTVKKKRPKLFFGKYESS